MTINVAVVTNEYVVLGCDSVASITQSFLNPVRFAQKDALGNYIQDADGKFVARFAYEDLQEVVTDAWGGVTKMFCLSSAAATPIAAVTAGLAQLNGKTISSLGYDFERQHAAQPVNNVREVVNTFAAYMGQRYDQHWQASGVPPALRSDVEFLVGGFGEQESFPSLYRINLIKPEDVRVTPVYGEGPDYSGRTGLAWSGQSDGVQRLLYGYDQPLRWRIQNQATKLVDELHQQMSGATLRILTDVLASLGAELPANVNTELPAKPQVEFAWDEYLLDINYAALPVQSAVELVSYLVNLQSGKSKFVRGVPTVGGRTHIGLVKKNGFQLLNEPELTHRNTGYDRDL
jgi:hypothetical protein